MMPAFAPPDERLRTHLVTPELLDYIVQKIVQLCDPQQIILFGSRARGEARMDSDIDLFIVQDGPLRNRDVRRQIDWALAERLFGVDLIVRRPEEVALNVASRNPFYLHDVLEAGKILYERPSQSAN